MLPERRLSGKEWVVLVGLEAVYFGLVGLGLWLRGHWGEVMGVVDRVGVVGRVVEFLRWALG